MKPFLCFIILCASSFASAQANNAILTVYFDFNSSDLSANEQEKLNVFTANKNEYRIYKIEAHTDSIGSTKYNVELATRRMNSVKSTLKFQESTVVIVGEEKANIASVYEGFKFRKVDIYYEKLELPVKVNPEPLVKFPSENEPSLSSGASEFMESDEKTLAIDLYIHFQPGTAVPLEKSYPELDRLVAFMKENGRIEAFLHGHVCCNNNMDISERRANYVYFYLSRNGIQETRMDRIGHSNTQPKVFPERTETDRIANRRVTVVFTKQ